MSAIFGGKTPGPTRINQVQLNQSVLGYSLPVVMGKGKVQQSILWLDGFSSKKISVSGGGGKGFGGGKGGTQYVYSADVIAALCNGPISGVGDVWSGQSWLSNTAAAESYTITGGTPIYTPVNATSLAADLGVGENQPFTSTQNDLGSSGTNTLTGTHRVPFTRRSFGATLNVGDYSVDPSNGNYHFAAADVGRTVQISYAFSLGIVKQQERDLVPSGLTISVGGTVPFSQDGGVIYASGPNEGHALTRVFGTPSAAGTYSVSGSGPATYRFASGDINAEVIIKYKINNTSAIPQGTPTSLAFTIFEGLPGQAPWALLGSNFPGADIGYTDIAYAAYGPMDLGYGAQIQQNVFEVLTPDAYGGGINDCNPVQCILQVLSNKVWGLGAGSVPFPVSAIDNPAPTLRNYLLQSGELDQSPWASASFGGAPNGSVTPDAVTVNINGIQVVADQINLPATGGAGQSGWGQRFNVPVHVGVPWTFSVWMWAPTAQTVTLEFQDISDSSHGLSVNFNLTTTPTLYSGSVTWPGTATGTQLVALFRNAVNSPVAFYAAQAQAEPAASATAYQAQSSVYSVSSLGTWGGSGASKAVVDGSAFAWFAANGYFISPVIDKQDTAASVMSRWLEAGQCAAFMSEGLLKLVPFGDTSTAGNGCIWLAPSAFATALDDTCFLDKGKGQDPVKISSSPWQDAYNVVQVQWNNRTNQYAPEITAESDQAAINRYGSRIEDPQTWDFITTLPAATFAASMRVKRNVYTRNTYEFSLPYGFAYLEPMDVVEITTSSQWAAGLNNANLGIVNLPVRITKIVDNPDGTLDITAEDYPFGVHQPTIFNKDLAAGQVQPNVYADPGTSEVVMFEAPSRLTGYSGNEIWIGACGTTDDWGSCNIFVSMDGITYKQAGTIETPARLGVLGAAFGSGSDPDTTDSLVIDLAENAAALEAGTTADADADNTLCFVDGELVSYSAMAVTGQQQYTGTGYIRRGRMGSTIAAHAAGGLFLRLDDAVYRFTYDPTWVGKTLHFKFQSVNAFGNAAQDLSTLTAVSFTVPGQNPGTIDASSGLIINPSQFNVGAGNLGWNPAATSTDGPINYASAGYLGLAGAGVPTGVNPTHTYTRWTGYLIPTISGVYTIGVNSDDGCNLYLAGKPIVQQLGTSQAANASLAYKQGTLVELTAGVFYPIVLEWENGVGDYACQLLWSPPAVGIQLIPTGNLSSEIGSITGSLKASWWNGTPGLWFPSGSASVDNTNPLLPSFSPPENAGTGVSVATATRTTSLISSAPASDGINAVVPGWFSAQVYVSAGIVDIYLIGSSGGGQGYFFRLDGRVAFPLGQILRVDSNPTSVFVLIGSTIGASNPSNFTGWITVDCYYGNGYMALWINGAKRAEAEDNTYVPTPSSGSNIYYGNEVNSAGLIAPATSQPGSTFLKPQGSAVPIQPIQDPTWVTTTSAINLTWSAQTVALSDGSTVTISAGSKSYSGLSAGTNYFLYPYVRISDMTIQFANGAPPPTSVSSAFAITANSDGTYSMNPLQIPTPSSGTGSGGGGGRCPDSKELVDVRDRGIIPVIDVQAGDYIKGRSFRNNADVYRRVISVSSAVSLAWRIVKGYKVSPCEPIWDVASASYVPAFKAPGAVFDGSAGIKVLIHVDTDEYEECNYYLVGKDDPLLIHNVQLFS